jgi:hypothetical protein
MAKTTNKIVQAESNGRSNAKNARSSALGPGQFIDSTWLELMNRYKPNLVKNKSREQILNLRTDKALANEMVQRYADYNRQMLEQHGLPTDEGAIYLTHFLGPSGARAVLSADPTQPFTPELYPGADKAIKSNRPVLAGRTVGDVQRWARNKMGVADMANDKKKGKKATVDVEFMLEPPVIKDSGAGMPATRHHSASGPVKNPPKQVIDLAKLTKQARLQATKKKDAEIMANGPMRGQVAPTDLARQAQRPSGAGGATDNPKGLVAEMLEGLYNQRASEQGFLELLELVNNANASGITRKDEYLGGRGAGIMDALIGFGGKLGQALTSFSGHQGAMGAANVMNDYGQAAIMRPYLNALAGGEVYDTPAGLNQEGTKLMQDELLKTLAMDQEEGKANKTLAATLYKIAEDAEAAKAAAQFDARKFLTEFGLAQQKASETGRHNLMMEQLMGQRAMNQNNILDQLETMYELANTLPEEDRDLVKDQIRLELLGLLGNQGAE